MSACSKQITQQPLIKIRGCLKTLTMSEAEAQDKILTYSLTEPVYGVGIWDIKRDIFPKLNEDEIKHLLDNISLHHPAIAHVPHNENIIPNGLAEKFIEQGGFTEIETQTKIELAKQLEKEQIEFDKSKIDLELAKRMLKDFPKTKWQARIGITIAIVLALKELYIWIMQLSSP